MSNYELREVINTMKSIMGVTGEFDHDDSSKMDALEDAMSAMKTDDAIHSVDRREADSEFRHLLINKHEDGSFTTEAHKGTGEASKLAIYVESDPLTISILVRNGSEAEAIASEVNEKLDFDVSQKACEGADSILYQSRERDESLA